MKIRSSRMFMIPVLSEMFEDYINSHFYINLKIMRGKKRMKVVIKPDLVCPSLQQMIENGLADIVIHFECRKTRFRKSEIINLDEFESEFDCGDLNGDMEVVAFIIAKEDIKDYFSTSLSGDYEGATFNIEKGTILAISNQPDIPNDKNIYDFSNVNSIIGVAPTDIHKNDISFTFDREKIRINIPREIYKVYYGIGQTENDYTPILHQMLYVPALMYTFDYLRNMDDWIDVENDGWFKAIKKKCDTIYKKFDKELIEAETSVVLAQKMLESPVKKSLDTLVSMERRD